MQWDVQTGRVKVGWSQEIEYLKCCGYSDRICENVAQINF